MSLVLDIDLVLVSRVCRKPYESLEGLYMEVEGGAKLVSLRI